MLKDATDKLSLKKMPNPEARSNLLSEESYTQSDARQSEANSLPNDENDSLSVNNFYNVNCTSTRNFYLITNNIPSEQLGKVAPAVENDNDCFLTSTLYADEHSEHGDLDTVRTGESLIKHFNFDTSKYNYDTNKCIAFWRTLMKTGLQPVKCTLLKNYTKTDTTVEDEYSENEETDQSSSGMWYKALVELQKRKMDEVALAAVPKQCKLCEREEPYAKFKKKQGQTYSESELADDEDIACLNDWSPRKNLHKPQTKGSSTNVKHEDTILELLNEKPVLVVQNPTEESQILNYKINLSNDNNNARTHCIEKPDETINSPELESPEHKEAEYVLMVDTKEHEEAQNNDEVDTALQKVTKSSDVFVCDQNDFDCGASCQEDLSTKNKTTQIFEKCNICTNSCTCWDQKIALSQRLIDAQRNGSVNKPSKMNKSCGTETQKENKVGETKHEFCIICGHDDCNCRGTWHESHKHLDFTKIYKDKVNPLSKTTIVSKLSLHHQIYEQTIMTTDVSLSDANLNKVKPSDSLPSIILPTKLIQKPHHKKQTFFVTPEQRAKEIVNKNAHVLKPDKYGIPQVVRYGNGRLAPKPATSEDIFSDSEDDNLHN